MTNSMRRWLVALVVATFALWIGCGLAAYFVFDSVGDAGALGDAFGAINALFSGLALAGVIVAIIMQGQELRLQREELRLTREELSRQADAHEERLGFEREREARTEAAEKRAAHPRFEVRPGTRHSKRDEFRLFNFGAEVMDLRPASDVPERIVIESGRLVSNGYRSIIVDPPVAPSQFRVRFTTFRNEEGEIRLTYTEGGEVVLVEDPDEPASLPRERAQQSDSDE